MEHRALVWSRVESSCGHFRLTEKDYASGTRITSALDFLLNIVAISGVQGRLTGGGGEKSEHNKRASNLEGYFGSRWGTHGQHL